jgi:hypothetical protein
VSGKRQAKLAWLRETVNRSITGGGEASEQEIDQALKAKASELAKLAF